MTDLQQTIDAAWEDRANLGLSTGGEVRTVVAAGSADALRAQTGHSNLEDAFVSVIGSEEGLHA